MWIQHASRSELLDFVQGDNGAFGQAQEIEYTPSLRGELLFAWTNDPKWTRELPNLIVVDDDLHQFFAWTSTYLKNAKPLTALSRVVSSDGVSRLFESERYVAPSGLQTACLGVMAAEAVTHSASDTVRGVSRSALSETLSYAASQLMSHDPTPIEIPSLALHWASAQGFAGRANRRSDLDDVCNTWLVLFALRQAFSRHAAYMTLGSLPDELHDIASACREIATGGEISRDS
ncbi:MAG TPA: hypothetical protein PJ982_02585, partial [Lacipirellulaceae bacterium]|nr:hypothetical protein [Lacipirellulaceae bacterium]